MKTYNYIAFAGLLLAGCAGFLKEESQSEVIPKTTNDFSELLLGDGYPGSESVTDPKPDFKFTQFLDDDVAMILDYSIFDRNMWAAVTNPDHYVDNSITLTYMPLYTWQPYAFEQNGLGSKLNEAAGSTAYAGFYEKILGCNVVLDRIDDAIGPQDDKDRVKAEALALRSLYYFWLVNIYGQPYNYDKEALGVPVKLFSDLSEEDIARSTVGHIYDEIIVPDLVEAARLMDPLRLVRKNYRINQPAIHMLLARVYLYMDRYDDCITEVGEAVKQGIQMYDMTTGILLAPALFSYDNPEVEWLFGRSAVIDTEPYRAGSAPAFQAIWDKTNDRRYTVFNFAPKVPSYSQARPNEVLMDKPRSAAGLKMVVRAAEAYLNRAEAYARKGGSDAQARADLNTVRRNRIAGYVDDNTLAGQALLDEILLERRRELCFEGHRWFDLRRQGMPEIEHLYRDIVGGTTKVYTLEKNDPMYTVPFPRSVIDQNNAIKQNPSADMPDRMPTSL